MDLVVPGRGMDRRQRHLGQSQHIVHSPGAEGQVLAVTVAQAGQSGLPAPAVQTNDLSSAETDLGMSHIDDVDERQEALGLENEHAEAARLAEAENIMMDYIRLQNQGSTKPNTTLFAQ